MCRLVYKRYTYSERELPLPRSSPGQDIYFFCPSHIVISEPSVKTHQIGEHDQAAPHAPLNAFVLIATVQARPRTTSWQETSATNKAVVPAEKGTGADLPLQVQSHNGEVIIIMAIRAHDAPQTSSAARPRPSALLVPIPLTFG